MNSIQERINTINIVVKTIRGGFHGCEPVKYIQNICNVSMTTAVEITKLNISTIDNLVHEINNVTSITEGFIENKMRELGFHDVVINYIIGKMDNKKHPNGEYMVWISKGDCDGFVYKITRYGTSVYKHDNQLLIMPSQICPKNTNITTVNGVPCGCFFMYEYVDRTKPVRYISDVSPCDNYTFDNEKEQEQLKYQRIDELPLMRIWYPGKDYSICDRYLTLYNSTIEVSYCTVNGGYSEFNDENSLYHKMISPKGCKVFIKSGEQMIQRASKMYAVLQNTVFDGSMKIPLIDGLHMNSPLGQVVVKKIKTIDDHNIVNTWTDEDFDRFAAK